MNIKNKLEKQIRNELKLQSKNNIIKKLHYNSLKKGEKALDQFIKSKNLNNWLYSGFYDFKYTALGFFLQLCYISKIDEKKINNFLIENKKYHKEMKEISNSYIFINTNFKRKNEPIVSLAFSEFKRRLKLPTNQLMFKKEKDVLIFISDFVKNHYINTNGKIGIWGNIINYVLYYKKNKYFFNTKGEQISNSNGKEIYTFTECEYV